MKVPPGREAHLSSDILFLLWGKGRKSDTNWQLWLLK
jgi:hypothetical protein